jgi:catechol 2,3-dioxygenase-like lactoylglutathione lyase family enzyme
MITKFRHPGIVVEDMERSLRFYRDALGFSIVVDEIEKGEYLSRLIGLNDAIERVVKVAVQDGTVIELMEMLSPLAQMPSTYDFNVIGCNHIAFTVTDIEQIYTNLKSVGVEFISEPLSSPYDPVKTMFCYDPDKTLVQFVEIFDETTMRKGLE